MISGIENVEVFQDEVDMGETGKERLLLGRQSFLDNGFHNGKNSHFKVEEKNWFLRFLASVEVFYGTNIQAPLLLFFTRLFHFVRYNFGEVMKRRVAYCLGMMSCVLVVLACTATISVTEQLPLVFFRIAENEQGQYDLVIESDVTFGWSLNFTDLEKSVEKGSDSKEQHEKYMLQSPRMVYFATIFSHNKCRKWGPNGDRTIPIWYDGTNADDIQWFAGHPETSILINETDCNIIVSEYNDGIHAVSCESSICGNGVNVPLVAIDTERERKMGYGRKWDFPKMKKGECIITDTLADKLGVKVGDDLIINGGIFGNFNFYYLGVLQDIGWINPSDYSFPENKNDDSSSSFRSKWEYIRDAKIFQGYNFPSKVIGIVEGHLGKTDSVLKVDEPCVFVEFDSFYDHLGLYLDRYYFSSKDIENFRAADPYHYAMYVYLNARDRTELYNSANFDVVMDRVTAFTSTYLYLVGFDQVSVDYPLLIFLERITFINLFLNLIINIIITILVGLSVILIYTLLMINVEERTFEMGVLRMIGLKLQGLVEMIVMQSIMYSLPGILLGLLVGQLLYLCISFFLEYYIRAPIPYFISSESVLISVLLGVFIPLAGSVIPIRKAMGKSLQESLDTKRSKVKAVEIHIERLTDTSISWSLVVMAIGSFGFGFFIYYCFPLALITQRFQLLLFIFFAIIIMMEIGCVLLSLNLEGIIQNIITRVLFFWEFASVRKLIMKNLIAHKSRNRKTTIMYGISLGFLIFLSVSTRLEIRLYQFSQKRILGARFRLKQYLVRIHDMDLNSEALFSELDYLVKNEEYVEDYAYMSFPISKMTNDTYYTMQSIGGYHEEPTDVSAISPNFYEVLDEDFLIVTKYDESNDWGISEQLYSEGGACGFMGGLGEQKDFYSKRDLDLNIVYRFERPTEMYKKYRYFLMRYNSVLESGSGSTFSKYDTETSIHMELFRYKEGADGFISFPNMFLLLEHEGRYSGVEDIPIRFIFIRISDKAPEKDVLRLETRINDFMDDHRLIVDIENRKDRLDRLLVVENVLTIFFYLSTTLAMLMCFFSLISNMITNVHEQSKEIGILRAMGCRKFTLMRVYIYEALVLIYTSGIIGTCTGSFIGYTLVLQQQLFTQLPLGFVFPYEIVIIVFAVGLICGFLASVCPIHFLLRRTPVEIMRKV